MRVILKLSAILLLAVGLQLTIQRGIGALDEAAFECRVMISMLRGHPIDDPDLIDAASALLRRQSARALATRTPRRNVPTEVDVAEL